MKSRLIATVARIVSPIPYTGGETMAQTPRKQVLFAQNFLHDARLVRRLVRMTNIAASDTVYEIGPGRGIITAELAGIAKEVVAIEKDPVLARRLRERFRKHKNVRIILNDFLGERIRVCDYKIFASIPYNITTEIVRRAVFMPPFPAEAYLIMQKEPAKRFSGRPAETLFSLLAKPDVEFGIPHRLDRGDFRPVPAVDSVLLRISRRETPLFCPTEAAVYRAFVRGGFERAKPHLKSAFKRVFTYPQWKRIARDCGFSVNAMPTQLTFDQWTEVFRAFIRIRC